MGYQIRLDLVNQNGEIWCNSRLQWFCCILISFFYICNMFIMILIMIMMMFYISLYLKKTILTEQNVNNMFTGGYDGNTFLDSVECYDPEKDTWAEVTHMTSGRSGVGVAVTMEPCQKELPQCQKSDRESGASSPAYQSNSGFSSHHNQGHGGPYGKTT